MHPGNFAKNRFPSPRFQRGETRCGGPVWNTQNRRSEDNSLLQLVNVVVGLVIKMQKKQNNPVAENSRKMDLAMLNIASWSCKIVGRLTRKHVFFNLFAMISFHCQRCKTMPYSKF